MTEDQTTTVRVKKSTHDILRFMSYKQNKPIVDIMEELLKGKGPKLEDVKGNKD